MDDKSVLDVVQAGDGVLAGMRPDAVHACVTTISPECADELESLHRGHGSFYVSAPVAGRPDAAASGRLASFLGGPANAVERLMPACKSYSTSVTVISERPRIANVMKLAVNYNVISTIELISQSYIFAEKCGLPLEHLRDFYQQLWFAHPAPKMYAEKLLKRDFAGRGGFVMTGGLKDVRLMLSTATEAGTKLERTIVRRFYGRELGALVVTWGISLILSQGALTVFGPFLPAIPDPGGSIALGQYSFSVYWLMVIALACVLIAGLWALYNYTTFGLQARAAMQNRCNGESFGRRHGAS